MSDIIRESELLRYDLTFLKADAIHIESYIKLGGNYTDFIDFCRSQGITTVFYKYSYYDRKEYIITDDLLKQQTENSAERNFCKPWVQEYNHRTESLDYENPCALSLCAILGSIIIIFSLSNPWMQEEKAYDALCMYLGDHEDDLLNFYEYESAPSLMEELQDILLADKEFRYCTNKSARSDYMNRFMAKKNNKKFWSLTKGAKNEWDRKFRIDALVHQIYNEYRNECYRLKIKVGEGLPRSEE